MIPVVESLRFYHTCHSVTYQRRDNRNSRLEKEEEEEEMNTLFVFILSGFSFITGGWRNLHEAEAVRDQLENSWDPVEFRLTKVRGNKRIATETCREECKFSPLSLDLKFFYSCTTPSGSSAFPARVSRAL